MLLYFLSGIIFNVLESQIDMWLLDKICTTSSCGGGEGARDVRICEILNKVEKIMHSHVDIII